MIDIRQFREYVVKPALLAIDGWSVAAEILVLGTAIQESRLCFIKQIGGPALGLFQMEPATHDDILDNYVKARGSLYSALMSMAASAPKPLSQQLKSNLLYAAAMCRIHYMRKSERLPSADDIDGMADYWKRHYNTPAGAGTAKEWADNYRAFVKN